MTSLHSVGPTVLRTILQLAGALTLLCIPTSLTAQYSEQTSTLAPGPGVTPQAFDRDEIPAHIAVVDGAATIEREGRVDEALENDAILAGDRLRTERGRVEILFADGSALDVDQFSSVDFLSESLLRLLAGRVRLSLARVSPTLDYRVDAAAGSVMIRNAGEYRIELIEARNGAGELNVAVLRGAAELQNVLGRTLVRAGTFARAGVNMAPSLPYGFNSASWDVFDRWVEDQRDTRYGPASSRYLPTDLRYYSGSFDRYGSWEYEPTYGYVWYPRVEPVWRPYYAGRWSFLTRIGWFWVGVGRWAWPTHHYGRWGLNVNRWYWIPDYRWSPAWVSWASAPGYVSWCPLGYDGRPVISVTNIIYRPGWTVLPSRAFASNVIVTNHVVEARQLSANVRGSLAMGRTGPLTVGASRTGVPLRAPSGNWTSTRETVRPDGHGYAVPRNSSPNLSQSQAARSAYPARPDPTIREGSLSRTPDPPGRPAEMSRSRAWGPGRPEPAPEPPSRTSAVPRQDTPSGPPPGWRSESRRDGRNAPQRSAPPPRVDPGPAREDAPPPSRPDRGPSRAAPNSDRGPGRVESNGPPSRDPGGQPPPGSRTRPSGSPDQGRAVPRQGRGGH